METYAFKQCNSIKSPDGKLSLLSNTPGTVSVSSATTSQILHCNEPAFVNSTANITSTFNVQVLDINDGTSVFTTGLRTLSKMAPFAAAPNDRIASKLKKRNISELAAKFLRKLTVNLCVTQWNFTQRMMMERRWRASFIAYRLPMASNFITMRTEPCVSIVLFILKDKHKWND